MPAPRPGRANRITTPAQRVASAGGSLARPFRLFTAYADGFTGRGHPSDDLREHHRGAELPHDFPTASAPESIRSPFNPVSEVPSLSEAYEKCLETSEVTFEELGPAQPERPVLPSVGDDRDDEVGGGDPAPFLETVRELAVGRLLLVLRAPLLEDLDHGHAVGALEAEAGVLGDDVADRVLGDDLG